MKSTQSEKLFKEAEKYLVGGVNSPVRSFNGVGGHPLVMHHGKGAVLYDRDGNAYTDYCLSWGALICGHAHRNAVLGAKKTVERGTSFGTTTRAEVEIARHIVECVPSVEMVRFVNSGTEATMSAIRLARGYTGRPLVVKFDGCYHGHVDDLLTTAGSGVAALAESSSKGIPAEHVRNTLSLPYNDAQTFKTTLDKHKDGIACVIIEPVAGNMGVIPSEPAFLQTVRDLTKKYGIILIFDEIMSGFRSGPGCVQSDYGIIPDMTCLGKIIGGGFPIGAYGGRKEIMRALAPLGGVYQAGTFSGNPVVMWTGLSTLRLLNDAFYRSLNAKSETFAGEINRFFEEEGIEAHMSHYKAMLSIRFRREPVLNYADARAAAGGDRYVRLFHDLLKKGVYWPPADLEAFFISGMHTKKNLAQLKEALVEYFG